MRGVVRGGDIGDVLSVQYMEPIGNIHQSHAFVRGNWRNEKESTPILLSKSCHDLDLFHWVLGRPCRKVSSFGRLSGIRREHAPAGSPARCTDGCPLEQECPYSAPRIYVRDRSWDVAYDLAHACLGLGGVHVRQGEFEAAMSILARGLALTDEVPWLRPPIVADLGLAQARCGRVVEGMALVNEAVERASTIGRISRMALLIVKCGEVHLLAGDALTASDCAAKALRLATEQKERGNVVYATRLFAAIRASEQPGSPR